MAEIAIVGGGPSGAMCGEQLARAGNKVTIFDEHLAWEKPCGGGLTNKAIECFPFLLDNPYPKKLIREIELISSDEHHASLEMTHPIVIYSRTVLNGMLLDRARAAGCSVQRSHVFSVDTAGAKPRFCVDCEWRVSDFLVLAGGALSIALFTVLWLGIEYAISWITLIPWPWLLTTLQIVTGLGLFAAFFFLMAPVTAVFAAVTVF